MCHLLLGDAHAVVGDVEQDTAAGQRLASHVHLGVLGRERGGVLHDLGHEVHHVVDGLADYLDTGLHVEHDALVLLDFRDRGAENVNERNWLAPATARGLVAREDQEVFRVAAHTSREVVQAEQAGQPVSVLLRLLQVVDQGQLPLDERLAAARQVDEHRVQVAAQHGFVGGQPDRFPVDLVEGPRHFTDFVGGRDADRLDLGGRVAAFAHAQPADHLGQLAAGDLKGVGAQLAQRADHGPRHEGRDEQDDDQQQQRCDGDDQRVVQRVRLKRVGLRGDVADQVVTDLAHLVDLEGLRGHPAGGLAARPAGLLLSDGQRLARVSGRDSELLRALRLVDLRAGDGVVLLLLLVDRCRLLEGGGVRGLLLSRLVEVVQGARRQALRGALERLVQVGALQRGVVLHAEQRVEHRGVGLEGRVTRASRNVVGERGERLDDALVIRDHRQRGRLRRQGGLADELQVLDAAQHAVGEVERGLLAEASASVLVGQRGDLVGDAGGLLDVVLERRLERYSGRGNLG